MITIQCDNCDKTFEIDSREAGGKVPCPHCGDINRVPHDTEATPPKSGGMSGEQEIVVVRPAMFRAHPFRFLLVMLLVLGGATLSIAAWATEAVGFWVLWPGLLMLAAGLVWLFMWWMATTVWIKVSITNKRTIRWEGIIRRHSTEVLHDHVRSVDIKQNFIQRLFNVGYIGIDSAGQDDIEIEIRDIPGPYKVKEIIDRYRKM